MITKTDILHLAALARINVSEEENTKLQKDFESILGYISLITEVSAEKLQKEAGELRNVLREDGVPHEPGIHTRELLALAPQREGGHVKVEKIL